MKRALPIAGLLVGVLALSACGTEQPAEVAEPVASASAHPTPVPAEQPAPKEIVAKPTPKPKAPETNQPGPVSAAVATADHSDRVRQATADALKDVPDAWSVEFLGRVVYNICTNPSSDPGMGEPTREVDGKVQALGYPVGSNGWAFCARGASVKRATDALEAGHPVKAKAIAMEAAKIAGLSS